MENELLINLIPRIYHNDELAPFLRSIDRSLMGLEKQVDDITALVDIDMCPDFALPYLAAYTNCPLWGQSPLLWRKQIKNWPHVCRMKGTKKAIQYFFDSLGIVSEKIETYWRNQTGEYKTERPDGVPFWDATSGLWCNSRTHYFSVLLSADEENIVNLPDPDLRVVSKNILQWIDFVKPFHAELLRLAWTVNTVILMEIRQRAEILQIIDTHQSQWNLGSARRIRWDKKSVKWNGAGRWNGLSPDELYRTRQMIKSDSTAYVDSRQFGAPTPRIYALGIYDAHLPYEVKLDAECMSVVNAPQPCGIKTKSDSVAIVDSPQHIKHQSSILALGTYDAKQPYMTTQKSNNTAVVDAPQRAKNDSRIECKGTVDARINKGSDPREINRFNRTVCFNGCTTWGGVKVRTGYQDIQCVIIRTKYGRQTGVERL